MRDSGVGMLDGEVENLYHLLTDAETSAGTKVDARSRFERNGLDPDTILSHFVSCQTIRIHLKDCLGSRRIETQNLIQLMRRAPSSNCGLEPRRLPGKRSIDSVSLVACRSANQQ
ncbi:rod-determining factor RdfA [Halostagnicola sp. A-GB9-2]|uniref:rod-determining factor RdfA n=1 Tax=Halostagnicola sp. A-GB9-2 TaxID=3048066 RepID=UPI0031F3318F